MDDARARMPETDSVFSTSCLQEVVDLFVLGFGPFQIRYASNLGFDQVIAVDRRGYSHLQTTFSFLHLDRYLIQIFEKRAG